MVGSEVYSTEVKKTEVLSEVFRRAIGASSFGLRRLDVLTHGVRPEDKGSEGGL